MPDVSAVAVVAAVAAVAVVAAVTRFYGPWPEGTLPQLDNKVLSFSSFHPNLTTK